MLFYFQFAITPQNDGQTGRASRAQLDRLYPGTMVVNPAQRGPPQQCLTAGNAVSIMYKNSDLNQPKTPTFIEN